MDEIRASTKKAALVDGYTRLASILCVLVLPQAATALRPQQSFCLISRGMN